MEMKNWIEGVEAKLEKHGVDVATVKELAAQIEQKMARSNRGGGPSLADTFGTQLAESDKFKSFQASGYQGKARIELKQVTSSTAGGVWSARDPELVGMAKQRLRVRDLLTVVPTSAGSIDYARQVTRTNAAAPVAEGAAKPYSDYAWEEVNLPMRTIAHLAKLTRQAMDDSEQLAAEVENEMRYGLGLVEEDQLLNGDGVGQNIDGLVANATSFAAPFTMAAPNMIDVIGLAILQQGLTDFETDGVIVNSTDWMRLLLIKDGDGKYILGDPGAQVTPQLFGIPVVTTQAQAADQFTIGGFKRQKLYDRLSPEVLISSENSNDFELNLFTMRCEERINLAVRQPTALVHGDFSAAITAATAA